MKQQTAADIINSAAVECGLEPTTGDPFSSQAPHFRQLSTMLNNMGDELMLYHDWQELTDSATIITAENDTGVYDLPSDYASMIPGTGWDNTNRWPMEGPVSPQERSYLEGRKLNQQTVRVTWWISKNKLNVFPKPPPVGRVLTYEYQSRNWVRNPGGVRKDTVQKGADIVLFPSIVAKFFLKYRYLAAKGFDTTQAVTELERSLERVMGKDKSARILNLGREGRELPYINPWRNVADTGFGLDVW